MTPAQGVQVWTLVGYIGAEPQFQAAPGGPILPRRLARIRAASEGYHAIFRNPTPARPAPVSKSDPGVSADTVISLVWIAMIAGCSVGC